MLENNSAVGWWGTGLFVFGVLIFLISLKSKISSKQPSLRKPPDQRRLL
jgi:hypothetical protein